MVSRKTDVGGSKNRYNDAFPQEKVVLYILIEKTTLFPILEVSLFLEKSKL